MSTSADTNDGHENYSDLFETAGSEVEHRKIFRKKSTKYIPDIVFISIYVSVFCISAGLDVVFLYYLFAEVKEAVFGIFYYLTTWITIISMILMNEGREWAAEGKLQVLVFVLGILHLECFFIGTVALKSAFRESPTKYFQQNSEKFFQMEENKLSPVKVYCFLSSMFKCIPQLFITSIFLTAKNHNVKESVANVCKFIIFNNMVVFSFTMAILFPIRRKARIFLSEIPLILNAAFKFMGTMCACCLFLTIFSQTFIYIGYFAFLLRSVRLFFLVWPCWTSLRQECRLRQRGFFGFLVYCPMLSFVLSFIYIHPFAGKGNLTYYFLYFANFLYDIICIYIFTPAEPKFTVLVYALEILLGGFVCLFGLINALHKSKSESDFKMTRNTVTDIVN